METTPPDNPTVGSDISTLYTRFGKAGEAGHYQEVVRDHAAMHAALRWPLLAEMEGIPVPHHPGPGAPTSA